jgi:hypothetical protein
VDLDTLRNAANVHSMPIRSLASHLREHATLQGAPLEGRFTTQSMRNAIRGTRRNQSAPSSALDNWVSPEDELLQAIKNDPNSVYIALLSNWCKVTQQCVSTHYEVPSLCTSTIERDHVCHL